MSSGKSDNLPPPLPPPSPPHTHPSSLTHPLVFVDTKIEWLARGLNTSLANLGLAEEKRTPQEQ